VQFGNLHGCLERFAKTKFMQRLLGLLFIITAMVTTNFIYAGELVLVAADSAPTAYIQNGKPAGILVDVVTEAFRRAGYPITIRLMPWARCLAEVRKGTVDGIFSVFKLPEREVFLTYTDIPIIIQVESFFVTADSDITFEGDFSKLKDTKIGIILGTSYGPNIDGLIRDGTWKDVTKTNHVDSLVAMLIRKRFDVAVGYRYVVLDAAKKMGVLDQIKELTPGADSIPSYLAFTKKRDYTKIISDFNWALTSMKEDGTFAAIYDKYQ